MNGIKNYLVCHGEAQLTSVIEEERSKVMSLYPASYSISISIEVGQNSAVCLSNLPRQMTTL